MTQDKMPLRPVYWMGSSLKDLRKMPGQVQDDVGYALYMAQNGLKPTNAKTLKSFGSAGVLEVVENDSAGTYRAVYTVRFSQAVYVLHCFQKKSTQGVSTSKQDLDLIRIRLMEAARMVKGDRR
jgi:phage-related protein